MQIEGRSAVARVNLFAYNLYFYTSKQIQPNLRALVSSLLLGLHVHYVAMGCPALRPCEWGDESGGMD